MLPDVCVEELSLDQKIAYLFGNQSSTRYCLAVARMQGDSASEVLPLSFFFFLLFLFLFLFLVRQSPVHEPADLCGSRMQGNLHLTESSSI